MSGKNNSEERRGMIIGGLITMGVGLLFLLHNFDVIPGMHKMWPVIPVIIGAFSKGKKSDDSD
jgi:hypothetical protein